MEERRYVFNNQPDEQTNDDQYFTVLSRAMLEERAVKLFVPLQDEIIPTGDEKPFTINAHYTNGFKRADANQALSFEEKIGISLKGKFNLEEIPEVALEMRALTIGFRDEETAKRFVKTLQSPSLPDELRSCELHIFPRTLPKFGNHLPSKTENHSAPSKTGRQEDVFCYAVTLPPALIVPSVTINADKEKTRLERASSRAGHNMASAAETSYNFLRDTLDFNGNDDHKKGTMHKAVNAVRDLMNLQQLCAQDIEDGHIQLDQAGNVEVVSVKKNFGRTASASKYFNTEPGDREWHNNQVRFFRDDQVVRFYDQGQKQWRNAIPVRILRETFANASKKLGIAIDSENDPLERSLGVFFGEKSGGKGAVDNKEAFYSPHVAQQIVLNSLADALLDKQIAECQTFGGKLEAQKDTPAAEVKQNTFVQGHYLTERKALLEVLKKGVALPFGEERAEMVEKACGYRQAMVKLANNQIKSLQQAGRPQDKQTCIQNLCGMIQAGFVLDQCGAEAKASFFEQATPVLLAALEDSKKLAVACKANSKEALRANNTVSFYKKNIATLIDAGMELPEELAHTLPFFQKEAKEATSPRDEAVATPAETTVQQQTWAAIIDGLQQGTKKGLFSAKTAPESAPFVLNKLNVQLNKQGEDTKRGIQGCIANFSKWLKKPSLQANNDKIAGAIIDALAEKPSKAILNEDEQACVTILTQLQRNYPTCVAALSCTTEKAKQTMLRDETKFLMEYGNFVIANPSFLEATCTNVTTALTFPDALKAQVKALDPKTFFSPVVKELLCKTEVALTQSYCNMVECLPESHILFSAKSNKEQGKTTLLRVIGEKLEQDQQRYTNLHPVQAATTNLGAPQGHAPVAPARRQEGGWRTAAVANKNNDHVAGFGGRGRGGNGAQPSRPNKTDYMNNNNNVKE